MKLDDEIRIARNKRKWSQGKFGAMLGVTQQAVSEWEHGCSIAKEHWPGIKQFLGVDVESVLESDGEPCCHAAVGNVIAHQPAGGFQTVMGELFAQITDWVSAVDGSDTRAAMDFAEELYNRFPELKDWKKKQRQSGVAGTAPQHQDRKVANGGRGGG